MSETPPKLFDLGGEILYDKKMITLILGLILLITPFVLAGLFSDKKRGFIYILFFLSLFQTVLAILTQSLGIFYYWVIVGITLLTDAILVFVCLKLKRKEESGLGFRLKNIDWALVFVVAVAVLSLWQVHYNYTGKINLATDQTVSYQEVKNMVYEYPYFSDEWYAVSLVGGAINSHFLPVKNILNNTFFPNLEIFFHSLIAQITLILGLDPLLHYTILSIFINALIIVLVYLSLRIGKVSKLLSGIASLMMLYIVAGANLPGLWHLLPFTFGILFFLLSACFMEFGDTKTVLLSTILASLFYPPLIPFYFVGLMVFLLSKTRAPKEYLFKHISKILLISFIFLPVLCILLMISPAAGAVSYIFSRIFFTSFTAPMIPQINFYNIIPIPAILLAVFGFYPIFKGRKWTLLAEFILGVIFWVIYSLTTSRFFIEYERIAIFTSIIVILFTGFGLQYIEEYIKTRLKERWHKIIKVAEIAILVVFLFLVPFYTRGESWRKIIYIYPVNGVKVFPKSPANMYLAKDDLRIFKDIKSKKFLSIPWKGTVIGVATGNYPVLTKQGTISIGSNSTLGDFLKADCQGKKKLAKKYNLDYIYIYKFNCPSFEKVDESSEGLVLYKTNIN